ncbi:MAG: serine--tRNA ligase [Leptospirillum sp.]|jgi:seryl-tRNA synthetase
MLDKKRILHEEETIREALASRGQNFDFSPIRDLDREISQLKQTWEALREKRNRLAQDIGIKKRNGQPTEDLMDESRTVNELIAKDEGLLASLENKLDEMLWVIPNIPAEDVPKGASEADNVTIRTVGTPNSFPFEPKPHWELGAELGIMDVEHTSLVSGSRFSTLTGAGARLERALANYMLDLHTLPEHNPEGRYIEHSVPFLVRKEALMGTGQLPKFKEELFICPEDELYLIPTAEVPLTNMYRETILDSSELPIRMVAQTACFRREAGAAGRDSRGLIRQHQFQKVELVWITNPETSSTDHERLTADAERVLSGLGLPYRVIALCTGDLGFSSAKTYDLEVWMPSQNTYREISSCSNFGDFQARRAQIRFRDPKTKKTRFVHTLNGSGLAIGRAVAAILENNQQLDGTVRIPEALVPYMGGITEISSRKKGPK